MLELWQAYEHGALDLARVDSLQWTLLRAWISAYDEEQGRHRAAAAAHRGGGLQAPPLDWSRIPGGGGAAAHG